jgi:hypothetical protein
MPIPYAQVSDEQIGTSDVIAAVDPQTGTSRPVYGHQTVPALRWYPSEPYNVRVLEVAIEAGDGALFHELSRRVAVIKKAQQDESANELAKRHFEVEDGLTRIIRFSGSRNIEAQAAEPIKLLEVNNNTVASGVMPLGFDSAPASGIFFPSVIIEVTPAEFERIQTRELQLPRGWEIQEAELPKPTDSSRE